jgi:[NiFe] hydrogenase assembly HybE family chaperone
MMNLVLLPIDGEDWSDMQLGDKRPHEFPSGTYKFMANDIEGIGLCQTHSLYSPMREFVSHHQALRIAEDFLAGLFEECELSEEDRVDEELLGRVMRGEVTPEVDFDRFDEFAPMQAGVAPVRGDSESGVVVENKISRRDLLRGELKG